MNVDVNRIIDVMANRSAGRTATSDKEVAFLMVENEQLKRKVAGLEKNLKESQPQSAESKASQEKQTDNAK